MLFLLAEVRSTTNRQDPPKHDRSLFVNQKVQTDCANDVEIMIKNLFNLSPIESTFGSWAKNISVSALIGWKKSSVTGYGIVATAKVPSGAQMIKIPPSIWKPYSAEFNVMTINQENPRLLKSLVEISSKLLPNFPKQAEALVQSSALALKLMSEVAYPLDFPYSAMLRASTYPNEVNALPHPLTMDSAMYLDPLLKNTACYTDIMNRRKMYSYIGNSLFNTSNSSDPRYVAEVNSLVELFNWSMGTSYITLCIICLTCSCDRHNIEQRDVRSRLSIQSCACTGLC